MLRQAQHDIIGEDLARFDCFLIVSLNAEKAFATESPTPRKIQNRKQMLVRGNALTQISLKDFALRSAA